MALSIIIFPPGPWVVNPAPLQENFEKRAVDLEATPRRELGTKFNAVSGALPPQPLGDKSDQSEQHLATPRDVVAPGVSDLFHRLEARKDGASSPEY